MSREQPEITSEMARVPGVNRGTSWTQQLQRPKTCFGKLMKSVNRRCFEVPEEKHDFQTCQKRPDLAPKNMEICTDFHWAFVVRSKRIKMFTSANRSGFLLMILLFWKREVTTINKKRYPQTPSNLSSKVLAQVEFIGVFCENPYFFRAKQRVLNFLMLTRRQ